MLPQAQSLTVINKSVSLLHPARCRFFNLISYLCLDLVNLFSFHAIVVVAF